MKYPPFFTRSPDHLSFQMPSKQLARWLLESRDTLRAKYQKLKVDWKRLTVRVSDVSRSRDNWKQRAEVSDKQVQAMQAEIERLSALLEQGADSDLKKNGRPADFTDPDLARIVHS